MREDGIGRVRGFHSLMDGSGEFSDFKILSPLGRSALSLWSAHVTGQLAGRPSVRRGLGGATGRGNASFGGSVETPPDSQQCRDQVDAGQPEGCLQLLSTPFGDGLVSCKNVRVRRSADAEDSYLTLMRRPCLLALPLPFSGFSNTTLHGMPCGDVCVLIWVCEWLRLLHKKRPTYSRAFGVSLASNRRYSALPQPPLVGGMTVMASPASKMVWSQPFSSSIWPELRRT
ncbi:hypothetical protein SAMN04515695_4876 [Pseudovibrio sp. Tun.PSC04-5.I4]|nr:hypothetical protein SAMN04515695_4876 [Pseudovibrio sp. Tun.PSC04-5.I4]